MECFAIRGRDAIFFAMRRIQQANFLACALVILAMAGGCATQKSDTRPSEGPQAKPTEPGPELSARKGNVWVVRPDGSKSCGVKKGITPKAAAQELESAGVKVLKQRMGHDGLMRMQVCGADTGNLVELLIDGQGLPTASRIGFRIKGED